MEMTLNIMNVDLSRGNDCELVDIGNIPNFITANDTDDIIHGKLEGVILEYIKKYPEYDTQQICIYTSVAFTSNAYTQRNPLTGTGWLVTKSEELKEMPIPILIDSNVLIKRNIIQLVLSHGTTRPVEVIHTDTSRGARHIIFDEYGNILE